MICHHCKHKGVEWNEHPCVSCSFNATNKFEPINNFHRIKAMSVEELATFLSNPCECEVDPEIDGYIECGNDLCIKRIIKWLESEVTE